MTLCHALSRPLVWGQTLFLFIGLAGCSVSSFAAPRMPKGAFLLRPALTSTTLVEQVRTTPRVSARYARLFGVAPDHIQGVFRHLRAMRLSRDTPLDVYYIRPGEHSYYKRRIVKRGTAAWVNAQSQPLLIQGCGNPVRSGIMTAFHPKSSAPSETLIATAPITELDDASALIGPLRMAVPPMIPEESAVAPIVLATTTVRHIPTAAASVGAVGHGGGFPWFLGLLPLAALGGIHTGSGNSLTALSPGTQPIVTPGGGTTPGGGGGTQGGGTTPGGGGTTSGGGGTTPPGGGATSGGGTPPPAAVPESGTLLLGVSLAFTGLLAKRWKK